MENHHFTFFIVGCARSGTTLLRKLLDRHYKIAIPLESLFIIDYLRADSVIDLRLLKQLIIEEPEIKEWGLYPSLDDIKGCSNIKETINKLHFLYCEQKGKLFWGQKTPRFIRNLYLLQEYYPSSKYIHIIRDPRSVVSSMKTSNVHQSNAYYATKRWINDVSYGLEFEQKNSSMLRIYYENLVNNPKSVLENVCNFLQVEFDPNMLSLAPQTPEYSNYYSEVHKNLNRPPTPEMINQWKEYLSINEINLIESMSASLMQELGYERSVLNSKLNNIQVWNYKLERILGLSRQGFQYLRHRREYVKYLFYRKWKLKSLGDFLWEINQ